MKRFLLIFLFITSLCFSTVAETYEIMALTTPTITIGGKVFRKGDRFSDTKNIKWVDNRQSMRVKELSTGALYEFSRKVFESKGNALSIADYFLNTNKASTRGENDKPMFTKSTNSNLYPEKRIALVIGNSNYEYLSFLRNAQKDASDIAETLLGLGFDVMETYECTYPTMKTALNNFSAKARDYDVALFYYAGHGKQEKGQNYLVPIERELEFVSELNSCLNCEDILQRMEEANVPIKLVYLDACRDTKASWSRSADKGLARMEGPIGSVIVFSTQSGKVASDGEGPNSSNSPFAASMLKNIVSENVPFNEAMTRVVRDTYSLTNNVQYPLQIGTLISDFSFNTRKKQPAATAPVQKQTVPSVTQQQSADEQYKKGNDYYNKKDYQQAVVWYKKAAEQGNAAAQCSLGYMYGNGLGVEKNYAESVKWYRKSVEQGNAAAQYNLGYMYRNGLGVDKNYTEAVNWYRKSAEQGNSDAQNNLGFMYQNGLGVEKSYTEAVKWYRKSVEQGNSSAQNNLGYMYLNGLCVEKNYAEAVKWFKKAAEQGNAAAQNYLGYMYQNGFGVEKNYAEAVKWYERSAEQGNSYAQNNLEYMYQNGLGVEKNYAEAVKVYAEAVKVYGVVVDISGEPVIGATVSVVEAKNMTATDIDGNFTLKSVPVGATLKVSFVGYKTQTVKVQKSNASNMRIILRE